MRNWYIIGSAIFFLCGLLLYPFSQIRAGTAPTVNSVTAASSSQGNSSTLTLTENTTTTLYAHGTITDVDGCASVATNGSVTGKFYRTNHASGDGCSADNNDCYTITNANCAKTACDGPEDTTFFYECTAAIQYYADSTASGPHSTTDWTVKITATDSEAFSSSASDTIEVGSTISLDVGSSISYGSINLGAQSAEQTLTVTNAGNTGIDADLSVNGPMTCTSGGIAAPLVHYSLTQGFAYADGMSLSAQPTELELNLSNRTNDAASSTKDIYFKLSMPASGGGGACSNILTVSARADTENGW